MKFGIALGALHPALFEEAVVLAEQLGFESCWLPEHLIFTSDMSGSPHPGENLPPVPPTTPVFDAFAMLSYLAGKTTRIRLGTNVYLLGLRHPFAAARAVQTLDIVSHGRAEIGIGAGWLRQEWQATGLDPATRGRRLDEALQICFQLWSEPTVSFEGEFFRFDSVHFEPKPIQQPYPPIHVGGESIAALRRTARLGNGWIGMHHTPQSAREQIERIWAFQKEYGREGERVEISVGATLESPEDVAAFAAVGVDRLVVRPWRSSSGAIAGLHRFAEEVGL